MAKLNLWIFGYRKMKIMPEDISYVTSVLLRNSIPSVINNDGTITVRERDFLKTFDLLSGRIEIYYSEPLGLYGFWKRVPYKATLVVSCLMSLCIVLALSEVVWDIRVEGNTEITDSEVIFGLSECGFQIGDFWLTSDLGKVENAFLQSSNSVSWISINRRGTVAYVKVIEKENNVTEAPEEQSTYSNIVASADCVIEEITAKRGTVVVKVGDTVKKGDILVMGVLPAESGGGFCAAEATVVGRVSDIVCVEIDRKSELISYHDKKLYSINVNFLKFSLNIFKLYGNLTEECDIIDDEIAYSLFGRYKLPLWIKASYIVKPYSSAVEYTDEELVKIATERINSLVISRLAGGDLLKMKSYGGFTDKGYTISTDLVFLCNVGSREEFEVE